MPLISGSRYFRDLIGGQKINVTFGEVVTFRILRYNFVFQPQLEFFVLVPKASKSYIEIGLLQGSLRVTTFAKHLQNYLQSYQAKVDFALLNPAMP